MSSSSPPLSSTPTTPTLLLNQLHDAIRTADLLCFIQTAQQLTGSHLDTPQLGPPNGASGVATTAVTPLVECLKNTTEEEEELRVLFMEILLRRGADPLVLDSAGLTAMDIARGMKFQDAVELLRGWIAGTVQDEESLAAELLVMGHEELVSWVDGMQRDFEEAQKVYEQKLEVYNARLAAQASTSAPSQAESAPSQLPPPPPRSPPPPPPPTSPLPQALPVDPDDDDDYLAIRLSYLSSWTTKESLLSVLSPLLPPGSILNLFLGNDTKDYNNSALLALHPSVDFSTVFAQCQGLVVDGTVIKVERAVKRIFIEYLPLGSTKETYTRFVEEAGFEVLDAHVPYAASSHLWTRGWVTLRSFKRCSQAMAKLHNFLFAARTFKVSWAYEDCPKRGRTGPEHDAVMVNPGGITQFLHSSTVAPAMARLPVVPSSSVARPSIAISTNFGKPLTSTTLRESFCIRIAHLSTSSTIESIRSALPMAPPFILAIDFAEETEEHGRSAFVTFDSKLNPEEVVARLTGFEIDGSFVFATEESSGAQESFGGAVQASGPHMTSSTFAPPTKRKASVSFAESFSEDTKPRLSNLSISTPPTDVDYSHPMLAGVYYNAPRQFKVLRIRHLASTTDAQTIRTFLGTLMPSTVIGKISFMRYTSFSGYSVVVRLDPSFALDVLIQSHKNREIQLDDSSITLCVGLPAICVKGIFPNGTSMNDMLQKLEIRPMFYNAAFGIMTFTTYQEGVEAMKLLWDAVDEMGVQNFDCRWSYDDTPSVPEARPTQYFSPPPPKSLPSPASSDATRRSSIASSTSSAFPFPFPLPTNNKNNTIDPITLVIKSLPPTTTYETVLKLLCEVAGVDTEEKVGSVRFVNGEEMGEEVLVELKMDEKEVGEVIEWLGGAMVGDQTIRAFRESSSAPKKKRARFAAPPTPSLSPSPQPYEA